MSFNTKNNAKIKSEKFIKKNNANLTLEEYYAQKQKEDHMEHLTLKQYYNKLQRKLNEQDNNNQWICEICTWQNNDTNFCCNCEQIEQIKQEENDLKEITKNFKKLTYQAIKNNNENDIKNIHEEITNIIDKYEILFVLPVIKECCEELNKYLIALELQQIK